MDSAGTIDERPGSVAVPSGAADAFSRLLSLLLTGEISAQLFFGRLSARAASDDSRALLAAMAHDEARHAATLRYLRRRTGVAVCPRGTMDRDRFRSLVSADPGVHFARIAGLDAGVCIVLAAVTGRRTWLGRQPCRDIFSRIRADEGRHVSASLVLATRHGASPSRVRTEALAARAVLARVVAEETEALGRLGVDVSRLRARLESHGAEQQLAL